MMVNVQSIFESITGRKREILGKTLLTCHSIHQKCHINYDGTEIGSPR
jgi:hypothetical protein